MADHVRKQIRAAVRAAVTGLPLTGARVYDGRAYPLPVEQLPALNVLANDEPVQRETLGYPTLQQRLFRFYIDAIAKVDQENLQDALDDICKEVESAIAGSLATFTLGGLARGGVRLAETRFERDGETGALIGVARMEWEASYRVLETAPDVVQ